MRSHHVWCIRLWLYFTLYGEPMCLSYQPLYGTVLFRETILQCFVGQIKAKFLTTLVFHAPMCIEAQLQQQQTSIND